VSQGSAAGPVTYQYDYTNRLVQVQALDFNTGSLTPVAGYAYDALGRRIAKTVYSGGQPPVTTGFLFDGGHVIEERVNGVATASFVLDGSRSQDDGVIQMQRKSQPYYFHTDDQGNVLALTTTGGSVVERYDYDDFGAVTFLTSDGVPTSATSSAVGNVYCWGGLRLEAETRLQNDDAGGYFETATGRYVLRAGVPLRFDASPATFKGNNPWSGGGGSPVAMKKGTVKFFNEAKGFGRVAGGGWGYPGDNDPGAGNVVVGNFVGTVASSNSAVTAR
jgi:YD repeat-containing protein